MTIYSEMSNGILLMRPHQGVDHGTAAEIYDRISILSDNEINALLLDLSQAQYACAALLRIFLYLANRPNPVPVAVVGASEQFRGLVRLCGADTLVQEYFSVEEAQSALKAMLYDESDEPIKFIDEDDEEENLGTSLMNEDEDDDRLAHRSD
jgi:anti-anti-sigma regulatory factor